MVFRSFSASLVMLTVWVHDTKACEVTTSRACNVVPGADIVVNSACVLDGVVLPTTKVIVNEKKSVKISGGSNLGEIICEKCKRVDIDDSTIGGIKLVEPKKNGCLSITDSQVGGTLEVEKTKNFGITLDNACSSDGEGGMDISITEVNGGDISITSDTVGCTVGDVSISKNKVGSIEISGVELSSDASIKENTAMSINVEDIVIDGDFELANNKGLLRLNGDFSLEDVKVTGNEDVVAEMKNFGSLTFSENQDVTFECLGSTPDETSATFEKNTGEVIVSNCNFATLSCVDNNSVTVDLTSVTCFEDKCLDFPGCSSS